MLKTADRSPGSGCASYRAFMEEHVYAAEPVLAREDEASDALIAELRAKAKAEGLWAPHLPPEAGGTGEGFLYYADLNEEIGRSLWAQLVFNCQAPDAGNGEILHMFGTPEQKERFLRPLVEGDTRSFFSMTEPEVSGSDPTGLKTRAVLDGDEWVIDGHKWFSSGAEGSGFGIVMAVTDPDAEPHRRMSQILVPPTRRASDRARPHLRPPRPGLDDALRRVLRGCARPGREPARRARRRLPDRPEAPRARAASTT